MPRFTIGSLGTGIILALVAVAILHTWGAGLAVSRVLPAGRSARPGPQAPQPLAVDPVRGTVAVGEEKANDYELQDDGDWTGGLDAATW